MTIRKRLDRLERATVKPETRPSAIVREIVRPSVTGPELVAMMLRPFYDSDAVHIDRNPSEAEADMRARFAAITNA